MNTKEINITVIRNGEKQTIPVCMRYCTAAETAFEINTDKSIDDLNFRSQYDIIHLALGAIVAAYESEGKEAPVTAKDLLFEMTPAERNELFKAVIELRNEWYHVPAVVKEQDNKKEGEEGKNA